MTDISDSYRHDAGTDFSLGNVFGLSFSILGANFFPLALLGAMSSVPFLVVLILLPEAAGGHPGPAHQPTTGEALIAGFSSLLIFPMMIIAQAMILFGAFQDMRGRPVRIGPSIMVGLARILPIVGMSIVLLAGVMLGLVLLVIPGIIVALAWYVALPVCVVEKLGPIASLSRSAALTKGHRWKLLGILITFAFVGGDNSGACPRDTRGDRATALIRCRYIRLAGALFSLYGDCVRRHLSRPARDQRRHFYRPDCSGLRLTAF